MLYDFKLGHNTVEAIPEVLRNFAQVVRTSMIKQDQVGLKLDSKAMLFARVAKSGN